MDYFCENSGWHQAMYRSVFPEMALKDLRIQGFALEARLIQWARRTCMLAVEYGKRREVVRSAVTTVEAQTRAPGSRISLSFYHRPPNMSRDVSRAFFN
jgi:hypothetical protein